MRQGNGISATLFYITAEEIIQVCEVRESNIQTMTQLIANSDDIAIVTRNRKSIKEVLNNINKVATEKTRYKRRQNTSYDHLGNLNISRTI